jgi:hypothetical protein
MPMTGTVSPAARINVERERRHGTTGEEMDLIGALKKTGKKAERVLTGTQPNVDDIDILDTLKTEHNEVQTLLERLVESRSGRERKSLLTTIKAQLVPHLRAEEAVLYDAIGALRDKKSKQDAQEGHLEHALADKMLAKLAKISNALSPEFSAAAKVLKELVEHHVEEEESNIWRDAREYFPLEKREALNEQFEAAKKKVRV